MCWERKASSPRVRQIVFLRKPPVARTEGPDFGSLIACGVKPRARRMNWAVGAGGAPPPFLGGAETGGLG